jgi:hypothetical protein
MRFGSVCSGIEAASIACTKCGQPRIADKLKRDKLRKHGHTDWCGACYSKHALKIRNARVSPERKRGWNRKNRYGLTNADVAAMIADQDGKCAICTEPLPVRYHIDHCHSTSRVRGILCHGCNLKLPIIENGQLLERALAYIGKAAL